MMRTKRLFMAMAVSTFVLVAAVVQGQVPQLINYQGQLTDNSGNPTNGTVTMNFRIFEVATGGTALYTETQSVTVSNGVFNVLIGSVTPVPLTLFDSSPNRFLEITVNGTVLTPRRQFGSVPYAFRTRGSGLTLPFIENVSSSVTAFEITNNGTGGALLGTTFSTAGSVVGVRGIVGSTSPGGFSAGVRGINNGTGALGIGVYGSQAGSGWGVYGTTLSGRGVFGTSASGIGVFGDHTATTGTDAGVRGETASTSSEAVGVVGVVSSTAPGSFSAGIRGINNSTSGLGIGVYGSQAGSGWGVYGIAPSGRGVFGTSTSGTGVYGESSTGTGVVASTSTNAGTAIEVRNGKIKVTGAGLGTTTPVFIHRATAANISGNTTTIDHPSCNGNPNAILFITPNWNPGGVAPNVYNNHATGVFYTGTRWAIFNQDLAVMPVNAAFNVLVVTP